MDSVLIGKIAAVGSIIFLLVLFTVFSGRRNIGTALHVPRFQNHNSCYHNLEKIIRLRALNKTIIVTILNYAFSDLALHWIYRWERMKINKFIVYVLDRQSEKFLTEQGLGHVCYFNINSSSQNRTQYAAWGSAEFKRIGNSKMSITSDILRLNYSVLISEMDVVWLRDPREQLENLSKQYDVMSQGILNTTPDNKRNIGFFYLPCRNATISIINEVCDILLKDPLLWDQGVFNQVVDRASQRKVASDLILDSKIYMFENFFLNPNISMDNVTVAHLVGLDSASSKAYVLKERAYSEDVLGYLSGDRKYLTYDNVWKDANIQTEQLRKALNLSVTLNRTLILPRFHCDHIQFYNQFYNIHLPSDCTAERFIDIEYVGSHYSIRENSFIQNSMVPERILKSRVSYNETCAPDSRKNETATILNLGTLKCMPAIVPDNAIKTCPPAGHFHVVLGYGPVCK
ncbi:unnamed protein product [Rotaria magnacalcarata]|nr:unnamed protein product [Rotaria magnacalcarata]